MKLKWIVAKVSNGGPTFSSLQLAQTEAMGKMLQMNILQIVGSWACIAVTLATITAPQFHGVFPLCHSLKQCSTVVSPHSILCKPHYLRLIFCPLQHTHTHTHTHPNPFQLPLLHPGQHPQRHVELLASAPAVLEVAEAATSPLADVGVIEPAVSTETAVPTLVQPAHDQVSGKIRLDT